jgi:hypothetical protein
MPDCRQRTVRAAPTGIGQHPSLFATSTVSSQQLVLGKRTADRRRSSSCSRPALGAAPSPSTHSVAVSKRDAVAGQTRAAIPSAMSRWVLPGAGRAEEHQVVAGGHEVELARGERGRHGGPSVGGRSRSPRWSAGRERGGLDPCLPPWAWRASTSRSGQSQKLLMRPASLRARSASRSIPDASDGALSARDSHARSCPFPSSC